MSTEDQVNASFGDLLCGLSALRPYEEEGGQKIFSYYHKGNEGVDRHHPIILRAGEMDGIHWVDISIGLVQLRADRLEWATALQQANRDICIGKAIPRWLAIDELVGVAFVHRLDWQSVTARVLDRYIVNVLKEVHKSGSAGENNERNETTARLSPDHSGVDQTRPTSNTRSEEEARIRNRSFEELVNDMRSLKPRPVADIVDEGHDDSPDNSFEYEGGVVELLAGREGGVDWMDIVIRLHGFTIDRLDWAKKILKSNSEMSPATPIPTWFALDEKKRLLFINRLDWRFIEAEALDDHIRRCIEQMVPAITASGVGLIGNDRENHEDRDYRRDFF